MAHGTGPLDMGSLAMQGFGQAMDTMDFMKRAWSHFKVPASGAFVGRAAKLSAQPPAITLYESREIPLR